MLYDCIITGAGPGGIRGAICLGRYNRKTSSSTGAAGDGTVATIGIKSRLLELQ